ncbi:bifunctional phosphoserine phosphatase/homoserine phosphotransferase ThrH [Burkholderia sp. TSV86]|uniref:bifunctional phosphoserine phosphatase/homoserine phosphotransferase ThrH n=1 Tax=Burkholderia sp. TSV86 TaxID=1385594 RepID=UPI000AE53CC4|nr:bifunctional phosphoserine phosphatase/homoserine phosphotransferase ThrH [Burkholderia sp. TSV86]
MLVCLDIEGTLLPELWGEIAEATGIAALRITTRDEPDYHALMAARIRSLNEHGLSIGRLVSIVREVELLPGAREFLDEVRAHWPTLLVSDSYRDFLGPLAAKLGCAPAICHRLTFDAAGRVTGWAARLDDQKPKVVRAMQDLGYSVFAAGDSFNDIGMLKAADAARFINVPESIAAAHPEIGVCRDYHELFDAMSMLARRCGLREFG